MHILFLLLFQCVQIYATEKGLSHYFCNCDSISKISNSQSNPIPRPSKVRSVIKCIKNSDWAFNIHSANFWDTSSLGHRGGFGFGRTSLTNGVFKTDTFFLELGLGTNNFFPDMPLFFGIKAGTEVTVTQRFNTMKEARVSLPFNLFRLPVNAKMAKDHLKPGDIVRFVAYLNLTLGIQTLSALFPPSLLVGIKGEAILSGFFRVELQMLTDNRIRLRLSTYSQKTLKASAGVLISHALTSIQPIDSIINNNLLYFNLIGVELSFIKENKYFMDYVFNLNDEDASKAYDLVLSSPMRFIKDFRKTFKSIIKKIPHKEKQTSVFHDYISSTTQADKIAMEDIIQNKSIENFRIKKLFNGNFQNTITNKLLNLSYGIGHHVHNLSFTKKIIDLEDPRDFHLPWSRYYNPTFMRFKLNEFTLGLFRKFSMFAFPSVFEMKNDGSYIFKNMGLFNIRRNHFFFHKEFVKLRKLLIRSLSPDVFDQTHWIDQVNLKDENKLHGPHNGIFICIITFKAPVLKLLQQFSKNELSQKLEEYYQLLLAHNSIPKLRAYVFPSNRKRQIKFFVNKFYSILAKPENELTKVDIDSFMQLRSNVLHRDFGSGFILYLLKEYPLSDIVNIVVGMSGFDYTSHIVTLGSPLDTEINDKLFETNMDMILLPYEYKKVQYR